MWQQAVNIVLVGSLSPNAIHIPSVYNDRILQATVAEEIEILTLAPSADTPPPSPIQSAADDRKDACHRMAKCAEQEIRDSFIVNLRIGLPLF